MLAANGSGGGGAMASALSRALLGLWPQLQVSSWSGLCGEGGGQESESKTPVAGREKQGEGLWTGDNKGRGQARWEHQRQTGSDKCGETLRIQGRSPLYRKDGNLEGGQPGMQMYIHLSPK